MKPVSGADRKVFFGDTLWLSYGYLMDSLYIPYGKPMTRL